MDWKSAFEEIEKIKQEAQVEINQAGDLSQQETWRVKYLGRKGRLAVLTSLLANSPAEIRPKLGQAVNELKNYLQALLKKVSKEKKVSRKGKNLSLPGKPAISGLLHPLTLTTRRMVEIFVRMGFGVYTGPDIETDFNNFEALNMPVDHPARDMWDTFYLNQEGTLLLRTHTSPVQIRVMKELTPPFRVVAVGRCFRRDLLDASHSPVFHQLEGLMVGKRISFAHLKGILIYFCQELFGKQTRVNFTPSYFPFTEPSAEVSISCVICRGQGCPTCSRTGWLEILGCGMVHPQVFRKVGYNPDEFSGLAFGIGIERTAMLLHGITDIRFFLQNDLRFLRLFT
ncbi:MAG: phenylalanine--tRNA ligase subunit alpha [Candidatus Omnitrophica bacterium]|nr:phenylalanine--tRNA ligase subunit alpha [Candidatus Omnitrophota bacterium]MCM8769276.1 phenylalanine--tRNA ligase subunit alpha [Candidatus Omnitrophota bacterium]